MSNVDRDIYLQYFREFIQFAIDKQISLEDITHSSILASPDKDQILGFRSSKSTIRKLFNNLGVLSGIPEYNCFAENEVIIDDTMRSIIGNSVLDIYDHQSQKATDIRWLRILFFLCVKKSIRTNITLKDQIDQIL